MDREERVKHAGRLRLTDRWGTTAHGYNHSTRLQVTAYSQAGVPEAGAGKHGRGTSRSPRSCSACCRNAALHTGSQSSQPLLWTALAASPVEQCPCCECGSQFCDAAGRESSARRIDVTANTRRTVGWGAVRYASSAATAAPFSPQSQRARRRVLQAAVGAKLPVTRCNFASRNDVIERLACQETPPQRPPRYCSGMTTASPSQQFADHGTIA